MPGEFLDFDFNINRKITPRIGMTTERFIDFRKASLGNEIRIRKEDSSREIYAGKKGRELEQRRTYIGSKG